MTEWDAKAAKQRWLENVKPLPVRPKYFCLPWGGALLEWNLDPTTDRYVEAGPAEAHTSFRAYCLRYRMWPTHLDPPPGWVRTDKAGSQ